VENHASGVGGRGDLVDLEQLVADHLEVREGPEEELALAWVLAQEVQRRPAVDRAHLDLLIT
jgi:hypothetical protein